MQIRYLIGICHAQYSACATSDLDPPTYQISSRYRSYGSRDMLRTKNHGRRTVDGGRRTPHRHLDYQVSSWTKFRRDKKRWQKSHFYVLNRPKLCVLGEFLDENFDKINSNSPKSISTWAISYISQNTVKNSEYTIPLATIFKYFSVGISVRNLHQSVYTWDNHKSGKGKTKQNKNKNKTLKNVHLHFWKKLRKK